MKGVSEVHKFIVKPPFEVSVPPLVILVMTRVLLIVLGLATGRCEKTVRQSFVVMLAIGIVTIGVGVGLSYLGRSASAITVGIGYMHIESSSFGGAGNMNITSVLVQRAIVGQIGTCNLTLSKLHGMNFGKFNVGV